MYVNFKSTCEGDDFILNRALKTDPGTDGLSLREVQIGLCCLDPSTVHGGLSAQFRCQFIFYFYNSGKEYLNYDEFKYVHHYVIAIDLE